MEFKFNVNKLLPKKINKVTHTLIPEDFKGDRRELNECQRQLSRVLDDMGEASARAQGLNKSITSGIKLRDTDHVVYLLVDNEANNGLGSVVGLLKTGSKNLFMFDETGAHYQLKPRCILDFYVHESRQRMGLGNILYQYMLSEENIRPVKLAIDRPSEKFLAFLDKYYGLSKIIPQNNKFVVFQGFFDDERQDVRSNRYSLPPKLDISGQNNVHNNVGKSNSGMNGVQYPSSVTRSSFGRYAAARPPCSMANIIHNTAVLGPSAERTGEKPSTPAATHSKPERPRSLSLYSEEEQKYRTSELSTVPTPALPDHQPTPLATILRETEKTEKNVKPSPSCSQEVAGTNQHSRLDLKFYHSPLW
ncbi:PREDICTED: alpha-tubulin N-acetyltransferase-like isoform X2 [Dufourea novaeangliae]|uniref:Alpha-tubulin N-acetyltransferase n=1 Tax=Dufourea novaeangliae TaxID=178035 RepID=A0A154PJU1_DUFNO|nr:PREDICTED: alpha-tubulin N-acetyltransferase-like isoform X2 [Dufourea novaeangliae]KZC12095.1 Alpha-tubulin N-acetyltransferase [Dufourea novaeangliae]